MGLDDYSPDSSGEIAYQEMAIEESLLTKLKMIEPLVLKVINSDGRLFYSIERRSGALAFQSTALGKQLLVALRSGQASFYYYFPLHDVNPYVGLLFRCAERVDNPLFFSYVTKVLSNEVSKAVEIMNGLVDDMKREASSDKFKSVIRKFSKAADKRAKSLDSYIDALFERHSRLLVIRLDLSYEAGFFRARNDLQGRLAQVKEDWAKMQRDLHKGVPVKGMLGFACKLEYGHLKKFHFHLLIFYDGAAYRKDVVLAKLIGEHWRYEVTKGNGRYFNCNNKKWGYKFRWVGVMSYFDSSLVLNLKTEVAAYLTKIDYWVRFSSDGGRSFFRGKMPKLDGVKRGRPRSFVGVGTLQKIGDGLQ